MFIRFVLGVLIAIYGCYQLAVWPQLPIAFWSILGVVSIVALWGILHPLTSLFIRLPWQQSSIHFLTGFIIGLQLVFWQSFFYTPVPQPNLNQPIFITGQVTGNVQREPIGTSSDFKWRFDFLITEIQPSEGESQTFAIGQRPKVRLSWYRPDRSLNESQGSFHLYQNQTWQLAVKLKANHALLNPGAFDYEAYLFQESINATGYVLRQETAKNILLQATQPSYREVMTRYLDTLFTNSTFKNVFLALLVGQKSDIEPETWQVLQDTGTIHLMAISGLHMSIVAAMGYFLMGGLWSLAVRFNRHIPHKKIRHFMLDTPKPWVGTLGALVFATIYLNLAGFAIPTQRAWLMVVATLLMLRLSRGFQPFSTLALVALLVVIWEPRAVLSAGFWLSFMAVALIFSALSHPWIKRRSKWHQFWIIQLVLSLGLAPLIAFYYQQFPLMSIFANFLAVPFVTLWGLPALFGLSFVGTFLPSEWMAGLIWLNDYTWQILWDFLNLLIRSPINQVPMNIAIWQVVLMYAGWYGLLHLKQKHLRWVVAVGLIALLLWTLKPQRLEGVTVQVLDVGQAQAIVLFAEDATVVLDTGPRWSAALDGASLAILPTLKTHQRTAVDLLVVSHSDLDHAGGSERLIQQTEVRQAVSGQSDLSNANLTHKLFTPCEAGQTWQFSQLRLEMLAPLPVSQDWPEPKQDNDTSCVIKATFQSAEGEVSVLVMGDLSQSYEKRLVKYYAQTDKLKSTMLVAGHHGSKTSSSAEFLAAVAPQTLIFSSGYLNRFGFPSPQVLNNVKAQGAAWLNTACAGSILIQASPNSALTLESVRQTQSKWYHHRCLPSEQGRFYP